MKGRFIFMVVMALIFASIAVLIAKAWINNQIANPDSKATSVVIAATEIPFGVKLESVHVKTLNWPANSVPEGAFTKIEDVIGKIVKNNFYPGELITAKRLAEHLGGSTLSSLVSEHSRAISIRVDDVVGVSGFVLPGNRVDILSTRINRQDGREVAETNTILENIKVLAVDQEASPDKEKPALVKAVTLELRPEEAETMVSAMQEGKIQLTLRNPVDTSTYIKEPLPSPKPIIAPKPTPSPRAPTIKLIPW